MQRKIDVELLPLWGDRPITGITRADVKALLREKAQDGPIAANRLLALISKIFTWALDEEIVQALPAVRLPRLRRRAGARARSDSRRDPHPVGCFRQARYPFGAVFRMLLVTGQRRGEVADMKWSEIAGDGWKLPGASVKSAQGHLVPLSSLAREILRCVPRVGDRVFAAHSDKVLQGWSKAKARADALCTRRSLPGVSTISGSTTATHMRSIGIDRLVVSKILNHAEGGITRVYDRYAADPEKAAAMERWANRLREIIENKAVENVVALQRAAP